MKRNFSFIKTILIQFLWHFQFGTHISNSSYACKAIVQKNNKQLPAVCWNQYPFIYECLKGLASDRNLDFLLLSFHSHCRWEIFDTVLRVEIVYMLYMNNFDKKDWKISILNHSLIKFTTYPHYHGILMANESCLKNCVLYVRDLRVFLKPFFGIK